MTEAELKHILEDLNKGILSREYISRPISKNVDLAFIWGGTHAGKAEIIRQYFPDKFYLIKNEAVKYGSIIQDLKNDLHVYTLNEQRGKGLLKNNFKEVIFRHLSIDRNEQRITIENWNEKALKLANKLAFIEDGIEEGSTVLKIDLNQYKTMENELESNELSGQELIDLRVEIQAYKELIQKIKYRIVLLNKYQTLQNLLKNGSNDLLLCENEIENITRELENINNQK